MNQNPVEQGKDAPNQSNQPGANPSAANGGLPEWMADSPQSTEMPAGSVVESAAIPKKKHKGLIFAVIFIVVLILTLGGFAAWYFLYYNNPEKVAYDAINGFLRQQAVVTDGIMTGRAKTDTGEVLVTVATNNKSTTSSADGAVTVKIGMLDANGELISDNQYEVELGGIIMTDGVIYVRTGKLMESIDLFMEDMNVTLDELDTGTRAVYNLLNDIDGEWWQISVPDVINSVVEDPDLASASKEFYACLINVAHSDVKGEIADIYSLNRFVNISRSDTHGDGTTDYNVEFDYDKMASFANAMIESGSMKSTENCLRKYIVDDLGGDLKFENESADASKIQESLKDTSFIMSITDFGHELTGISISTKQGDSEFSGGFSFSHPEVTIEAPANYRPISDLVDMIVDTIMEVIVSDYDYDFDYDFDDDYDYDDWYPEEGDIEEV